jgi:hypothetical protein
MAASTRKGDTQREKTAQGPFTDRDRYEVEPKSMYLQRHEDVIVGTGIYK